MVLKDILAGQTLRADVPVRNIGGAVGTFQLTGGIRSKTGEVADTFDLESATVEPGVTKTIRLEASHWAGGVDTAYAQGELFDAFWSLRVLETGNIITASDVDVVRHRRITPSAPRKVSSTAHSPDIADMLIEWDGLAGATFDLLLYSNGQWGVIKTTTQTSFLHGNLKPATQYSFKVKATVNLASGPVSAIGAPANLTTASFVGPPAPGKVAGVAAYDIHPTTAMLTWQVPSGTVTTYGISVNGIERSAATPPVQLVGLEIGARQDVYVRAYNTSASPGPWSDLCTFNTPSTEPGGPQPPGTPYLVSSESTALSIAWSPSATSGVVYEVYRGRPAMPVEGWVFAGETSASSFRIAGLEPDTDYKVQVVARDSQGRKTAPQESAMMRTQPAGGGGQPPSAPGDPYRHSSSGSSWENMNLVIRWIPAADATSYSLEHCSDRIIYTGPATEVTVTGLSAQSPYSVRVYAFNAYGHAVNPSGCVTLWTLTPTTPTILPPPNPTPISVSAAQTSATFSWPAVPEATRGYKVRLTDSSTDYGEQGCGPTSMTWVNLTPGRSYTVTVKACNDSSSGAVQCSSGTSQPFTTQSAPPSGVPPVMTNASAQSDFYVIVWWNSGQGGDTTVYCSDGQSVKYYGVAPNTNKATGFMSLQPDTYYQFWAVGPGGASNVVGCRTQPAW